MTGRVIAIGMVAVLMGACGSRSGGGTGPSGKPATREEALVAWETVRGVLQHPRCQNCHPVGDAPLQGDDSHVHQQNVLRGPEGKGMVGMECTTCHGPANPPSNYGTHIPPGNVKEWHMPPPELKMVFVGVASAALCEQLKDPARNGGKDFAALRTHMDDPLVVWGWDPGFGRAPVSTPRAEFLTAFEAWASAGGPCPAP